MITDIMYPIFTLTITILACFIKKIAILFRDLHTRVHQGIALDPMEGLKLHRDPQLQSFLALPRTEVPIFFLYHPLVKVKKKDIKTMLVFFFVNFEQIPLIGFVFPLFSLNK